MEGSYKVKLCVNNRSETFHIPYYYTLDSDGSFFIVFNEVLVCADKTTTVTLTAGQTNQIRDEIGVKLKGEQT